LMFFLSEEAENEVLIYEWFAGTRDASTYRTQ
jgi:hypothetical protein